MRTVKVGCLFTHPGHRLTRFVLVAIDLNAETFTAFDEGSRRLVEFHFADQGDFRAAKLGPLDVLS